MLAFISNKYVLYVLLAVAVIGGLTGVYKWNAASIRTQVIEEVEADVGRSLINQVKKDKENEETINGLNDSELRDSAYEWLR